MSNIDRAAEIIGSAMSRWDLGGRPDMAEGIDVHLAVALAHAGLLAPDLPEPIINDDDGNSEWHADEYTVDVDRGMVGLWTPDGTHWEQTPNQARNLALALLAAADHAERNQK